MAGYLKNCKLFGSIHAYTEKGNLPWIENSWTLSKIINHTFINYYSIFKKNEVKDYAIYLKNKATFFISKIPDKLIILEENATFDKKGIKRFYSIDWAVKNQKFFKKIFIKKRPDKAFTELFINECIRAGLKNITLIDNLKKINNFNDLLVVGSSSSLLLELASKKILCISISNNQVSPLSNPSWEFHKVFDESLINENNQITNPLFLPSSNSFYKYLQKGTKVIPSNACLNHLSFRKFGVQTLLKKMLE